MEIKKDLGHKRFNAIDKGKERLENQNCEIEIKKNENFSKYTKNNWEKNLIKDIEKYTQNQDHDKPKYNNNKVNDHNNNSRNNNNYYDHDNIENSLFNNHFFSNQNNGRYQEKDNLLNQDSNNNNNKNKNKNVNNNKKTIQQLKQIQKQLGITTPQLSTKKLNDPNPNPNDIQSRKKPQSSENHNLLSLL